MARLQVGPALADNRLVAAQRAMPGDAGFVAVSGDGRRVAITAPRGGRAHPFDAATGAFLAAHAAPDIRGVAPARPAAAPPPARASSSASGERARPSAPIPSSGTPISAPPPGPDLATAPFASR